MPKYLPDPQTGEPGARNGVFATGIEHKMGLTASATCEMVFGDQGVPAVGYLVGDTHNGIAQMFKIMEFARMMLGVKAISTASTGYLNALQYAKTRVQGPDIAQLADKGAPRVTIIKHPEVRRSLLTQKGYAEGFRALYLFAAAHQDAVSARVVSGASPEVAARVNALLLPLIKGAGSERSFSCLVDSLQILGGSGYVTDYPLEQYVRDAKIDSLYEGITAIQAQDFLFRKVIKDEGRTLGFLLAAIRDFVEHDTTKQLEDSRVLLATAANDVAAMTASLREFASAGEQEPAELYRVGLRAVPYLLAAADLLVGWMLLRQAQVAAAAVELSQSEPEAAFYRGKITAAVFFAASVLPRLEAERVVTAAQDLIPMALTDTGF